MSTAPQTNSKTPPPWAHVLPVVRGLRRALPGTPICDVADLTSMWTMIYIEEPLLSSVRIGQRAEVLVDGLSSPLEGVVRWVSPRGYGPTMSPSSSMNSARPIARPSGVTIAGPRPRRR